MNLLQIAIIVIGILSLAAIYLRHRSLRRERSLRYLLDRLDALEQLLQRTRKRMSELREVVDRVPQDIAVEAHASLDTQDKVKQGLRNVLEHRLWISQHGLTASQNELDIACAAIDRAYASIAGQLGELESAGTALAEATEAALEQAAREPAGLTRPADDD